VFRVSTHADQRLLVDMLYEAVNWYDDGAEERPSLDSMLAEPRNARYVERWGRPADLAVVAIDRQEEPIGAAWCRAFPAHAPGYGFVAPDIPELAIAVYPEFRGAGVGSLLLGALLAHASAAGVPGVSLSVARSNRARHLYLRYGFAVVGGDGSSDTMLLRFVERGAPGPPVGPVHR
jgi:ribosomal protein S18 acetylase RimI-like enzyme